MLRRWLNNNTPADIYWECTLCGFDNNVNSESACILCGTQNNTTTSSGRGDFYTSHAATSGISGGGGGDGSSDVQSNANAAGADTIFISEDAQIQVAKYSSFSLSERQRQVAQNYRRLNKVSGSVYPCVCRSVYGYLSKKSMHVLYVIYFKAHCPNKCNFYILHV